jgi:hypothetical protein
MKICIFGSWQAHKAVEYKKEAGEIGKLIAERGHILMSGGGTGISKFVVESYRKNKGKKFIAYFPSEKVRKRVGEKKGPKPDEFVNTNMDYPERNLTMVKNCDAIIAIHGGLGTIAEMIHAVKDYHKKVSVIDKGEMADWIKAITPLKEKVFITKDIKKAIEYLEKK